MTLITCSFELVEPIAVAERILATQMANRSLPLFPGSTFNPTIMHGARVFESQTASTSKKIVEYKNKPMIMFPGDMDTGVESKEDTAAKEDFENAFTGGEAEVGEIVHLGMNTDFNLVELKGTAEPPYEIIYTSEFSYAVVTENNEKKVHLGVEFITEMPSEVFSSDFGN